MPEPRPSTPTLPPDAANPSAPVPHASLQPVTVNTLLIALGGLGVAFLVSPVFACVPSFAMEMVTLVGLVAVWGWFLWRLCVRIARWGRRGR